MSQPGQKVLGAPVCCNGGEVKEAAVLEGRACAHRSDLAFLNILEGRTYCTGRTLSGWLQLQGC